MEPENATLSGGKKKFFMITLGVVLVVVAGLLVGYLFMQKDILPGAEKNVYTQEEKLKILADLASATPKDTVKQQEEKMKILQNIAKQTPISTASSTEEKLRVLQALAANAGQ